MSYPFHNSCVEIQNLPFFKIVNRRIKSIRQLILSVRPLASLPYYKKIDLLFFCKLLANKFLANSTRW